MEFTQKQQEYVAKVCDRLALIAAGALVFGQFVPGHELNVTVMLSGVVFAILLFGYAITLHK